MADKNMLQLAALTAASIPDKTKRWLDIETSTTPPTPDSAPLRLNLDELNKSLFATEHSLAITSGTKTVSTPVFDSTQTWNSGGTTFTAQRMDITDTASDAASLLADWKVGGSSVWNVRKDGRTTARSLTLNGGTITANAPIIDASRTWNNAGVTFTGIKLALTNTASASASLPLSITSGGTNLLSLGIATSSTDSGIFVGSSNAFFRSSVSANVFEIGNGSTVAISGGTGAGFVQFNSSCRWLSTGYGGWFDCQLYRDAANTIGMRNSTAAQAFHVYNTYTSGSVYERGFLRWASNTLEIGAEHVGATARNVGFLAGGNTLITLDATTSAVFVRTASYFGWSARSRMRSDADGNVVLSNAAATDFSLIKFGGTTSSFPALKRSSTQLQCRLADDSGDAPFRAHFIGLPENTAPAGTADTARIFAEDNGSGKTRLMVIFGSGSAQQIAIEP